MNRMKILIIFMSLTHFGATQRYWNVPTTRRNWVYGNSTESSNYRTTTDSSNYRRTTEYYTNTLEIPTGNCASYEEKEEFISLNLSFTGLQRINERFINNSHINCLDLSHNNINYISPEALELLPNLLFLNLANNRISLSEFQLSKSYNNLRLKTLVLDYNVGNGMVFSSLEYSLAVAHVTHLYLRKSQIQDFSNTLPFVNVEYLYLTDNEIFSVENIVNAFPNTIYLYLERNYIKKFNGTTLSNLELLTLDGNRINKLCNQYCYDSSWLSLHGMTKLTHLSLNGNQIIEIASDSFLETSKLITLDLSFNEITTIRKDTFDSLAVLEVLSLSGNRLKTLPDFSFLKNIQNLALDKIDLKHIHTQSFKDLQSLKNLTLSNNNISTLEEEFLSNLISLEELDLSNNKLVYLPKGWMIPQNKLRTLNLTDNYFRDFQNLSLANTQSLQNLFLDRNGIEIINPHSFLNLSKTISIHLKDQSKSRLSEIQTNMDENNMGKPQDTTEYYNGQDEYY